MDDATQAIVELARRGVFEQIAARAVLKRLEHVVLVGFDGEHDDLRVGHVPEDPPRRLDPVHLGHADVEQDQIGFELAGELDRLGPIRCFGHHLELRPALDEAAHRLTIEHLVIDEQDPRRRIPHSSPIPVADRQSAALRLISP